MTILTNTVMKRKDWTLHARCKKIERELAVGFTRVPQARFVRHAFQA